MDRKAWWATVHGVTTERLILAPPRLGRRDQEFEHRHQSWYRFNRHEFEQALGVGDGQGGLACCSPWGHKESNTTEPLN